MRFPSPRLLSVLCLAAITLACSGESKSDDDDDDSRGGTGGTSGAGGMAGKPTATCPDPGEAIVPTAVIDDMEDQDAFVTEVADRSGGWWTAGDETVGASMVPVQTELTGDLALPEAISEPRCGSHYAMRVTGQGFLDWGAVMGVAFAFGERKDGEIGAIPYDVSAYEGVEFYARIGDTSTAEVRYQISDSNTDPDGGVCSEVRGSRDECYDSFGLSLPQLDMTWHHYKIPFAGLTQRDFGYQADGVVTSAAYELTFNFPAASIFDFWVDDLTFY
jgi:hypothetical protein